MTWDQQDFQEYRVLGQNTIYHVTHTPNHSVNLVAYRAAWLPSLADKDEYTLLLAFHNTTFQLALQKL